MVLVSLSDVLDHIEQIYSPLNLGSMIIQKVKLFRNTALDVITKGF